MSFQALFLRTTLKIGFREGNSAAFMAAVQKAGDFLPYGGKSPTQANNVTWCSVYIRLRTQAETICRK
jgi:hypothetical protein